MKKVVRSVTAVVTQCVDMELRDRTPIDILVDPNSPELKPLREEAARLHATLPKDAGGDEVEPIVFPEYAKGVTALEGCQFQGPSSNGRFLASGRERFILDSVGVPYEVTEFRLS